MCGWAGRMLNAEQAEHSSAAGQGHATAHVVSHAHEPGSPRFDSAPHCIRFDWQTRWLSGKELTPHRSSISAQACGAGQAECSMRSRLSIPAQPGRATRLRMLLRTRMSRASRASLPHSIADGAFGRPGTICRAAGSMSVPPSSIGRLHMSVPNAHGRLSLLSRPSPSPIISGKAPDRTARSGALSCHFAKEILTTVLAYASNNAIITVFKRFR